MNAFLSIAVPIGFLALVVSFIFYTESRLRALFRWSRPWLSRTLILFVVLASLATIVVGATASNKWLGGAYLLGGYVFTVFLYLSITLLVLHLAQWLRVPLGTTARIIALLMPLGLTLYGAFQANNFVVDHTEIRLAKLKAPVSVMLISDVHLGHHRGGDYLARIVEATNKQRPDVVLIMGDLVDSNVALSPKFFESLRLLAAPTFYVDGNHEKEIELQTVLKLISAEGVQILHNDIVMSNGLQIAGLDYMKADDSAIDLHPSVDTRTIASTLPQLKFDTAYPTVLMHHSPVGAQHAKTAGVDLMVAGHTHGGQLFPGTLVNTLLFPFNKGLYQDGQLQIFVSQGAGTFLQRIRLGSRNEINVLQLMPEESKRPPTLHFERGSFNG